MPQLNEKEMQSDAANVVAHALAHGTPQTVIVSPEQAANLCTLVRYPKPATKALRDAFANARRFNFIVR